MHSHTQTHVQTNARAHTHNTSHTLFYTHAHRWQGYIKDYDGGTLMECVMHPQVPYTRFPSMLRVQRLALDTHIRGVSSAHIIHKAREGGG